ncbi:MAG TPA: glycosyltransferase [Clostridia bacterium]|nr:glycosyltransferase [Clostridia bacterium]
MSTNWAAPWGGSEVLWSEAAEELVRKGHAAAASVYRWPKPAEQLSRLRKSGIVVHERGFPMASVRPVLLQKALRFLGHQASLRAFPAWLRGQKPDLICVSLGSPSEDTYLMDCCADCGVPYVIVVQANAEHIWPDDARARVLIRLFQNARRTFFVSRANLTLLETQLGIELHNGEVVRNPFNVRYDAVVPWPADNHLIKLACVARLDPRAKGQDMLLRVLASEPWRKREIAVSFFGKGEMEEGLKRLAERWGIGERARFCGHIDNIESVWADHHALILPSRFEGLPLAEVEAMLCGRPVIVTDVAGNAELVTEGVTGFIAEAPTERHLHQALERAWQKRSLWESMGKNAASSIRKFIPENPSAEFARRLLNLIEGAEPKCLTS